MTIRILLADDSQPYRGVIRRTSDQQADMAVVAEVGDGRAAVQEAVTQTPDLILMDIGTPQMDGIAATHITLAQQPGARVLELSLHRGAQYVQAMVEAGARGYVLKEDPFADLLPAIHEVVAGRPYFSPALGHSPDSDTDAG